jgi:hypothetical protein
MMTVGYCHFCTIVYTGINANHFYSNMRDKDVVCIKDWKKSIRKCFREDAVVGNYLD